MRAVVYHGRQDIRVQPWPDPPPPQAGEVQLAVSLAGLCGTDVAEFRSGPHLIPAGRGHPASGRSLPLVLGHELVGQVVAVGDACVSLQPGDRVVPGSGVWCGRCRWCRSGRTNLCRAYYTIGLHTDGGLAELVNVPEAICKPVAGLSDEVAVLAQPLAVALHAVDGCDATADDTIAVIGAGSVGALIVAACARRGIQTIAVDVAESRLRTAERLGAYVTFDAGTQPAAALIRQVTGGDGADIVVECSGSPAGLRTAMEAVRRGGRLQLVGLHRDASGLDLTRLVLEEISLHTAKVHVCDRDLPQAIAMLRSNPSLAEILLEPVIDLADVVEAGLMRMASARVGGKVVVKP